MCSWILGYCGFLAGAMNAWLVRTSWWYSTVGLREEDLGLLGVALSAPVLALVGVCIGRKLDRIRQSLHSDEDRGEHRD